MVTFPNPLMKKDPLAFDFQSTTPCSERVIEEMIPYWKQIWGNPSSRQNRLHLLASSAISVAREELALLLNASDKKLIFTSGATEANNLALLGFARKKAEENGSCGHLITLQTEHQAVLEPLRQLRKEGFRLTELRPNANGLICIESLIDAFEDDTFLVSVMLANNEIGVLQPIQQIASLCKSREILFHTDAVQGFGQIPLDIDEIGADFLTLSGHKIYGPKGIGLLVASADCSLKPLQWGGSQEYSCRPGTVPVPLVIGFTKAAEIAVDQLEDQAQKLQNLRNLLWLGLQERIPELLLNGSFEERLPNNLNFTVKGIVGSRFHKRLRPFISCSSGSACSNGSPSHVLISLGRSTKEAEASLRLSIGRTTSLEEVNVAIERIAEVVHELRH